MADITNVVKPPEQNNNANWETAKAVLIRIGKITLRILSYIMNVVLTIMLIGLICGVIVGTVFAIYIKNYVDPEIDSSLFVSASSDSTTRIYYMDFETENDRINEDGIAVELEDQRLYSSDNSIWAKYEQMPKHLIDAFTSIEDHRFWTHNGVDWLRTGSAVISYFFGDGDFGGSTITQQLVKNLTGDNENSIQRKVQEIFRAINLENEMSKEQILEMYLNIVYLSNNCYGVQAASETYFGKDVSELSLVECASLAAIVKNPSQYEPIYHNIAYGRAREGKGTHNKDQNGNFVEVEKGKGEFEERGNRSRRNDVLWTMWQYGKITEVEYEAAINTELVLKNGDDKEETKVTTVNSWYTDAVIEDVQNSLMEKYGYSEYVASLMIYTGGLQIYTCMDPDVQNILENIYENDAKNLPSASDGLQPESAMIVIDPYTNDVLGLVGGRGTKSQNRILNRATQAKRPSGSCIKPLSVYGPAIDMGIATMGTAYDDSPVRFVGEKGKTAWPHNLPDVYNGMTPVYDALRRSVNTIAVRMLEDVGVDYSFNFLKNTLHMDSVIESYTTASGAVVSDKDLAPLALGQFSYGVTLWEMTAGYSIFQNQGVYYDSRLWYEVKDNDGNVLLENPAQYEIAISEEAASIMTMMLKDVITSGTGTAITLDQYVDVAGKTGTTTADFDRWFIGYTPYFVGGVWTGYDMNQALSDFGRNPSLQIWDKVMTELHKDILDKAAKGGEAVKKFEYSDQLVECTYCKDSGKLVSAACKADPRGNRSAKGFFTKDTMPTEYCTTHVLVNYDKSTSSIACPGCPAGSIKQVGLLNVQRNFPVQIKVVDAQYTCMPDFNFALGKSAASLPYYSAALKGAYAGTSGGKSLYNRICQTHKNVVPAPAPDPDTTTDETPGSETAAPETNN